VPASTGLNVGKTVGSGVTPESTGLNVGKIVGESPSPCVGEITGEGVDIVGAANGAANGASIGGSAAKGAIGEDGANGAITVGSRPLPVSSVGNGVIVGVSEGNED